MPSVKWGEVCNRLVEHPRVALLVAWGFGEALAPLLSPEGKDLHRDFGSAMRDWAQAPETSQMVDIYNRWWPRLLAQYSRRPEYNAPKHPEQLALSTAYLQVLAIMPLLPPRVLPGDGFYDMGPEHFAQFGEQIAKVTGASRGVFRLRAEHLLAIAEQSWTEQCAMTDRMVWSHPVDETEVPPRLRRAVVALACGAPARWDEAGVRIEAAEGEVLRHALNPEESALLEAWEPSRR